jgi:hypothetical protein
MLELFQTVTTKGILQQGIKRLGGRVSAVAPTASHGLPDLFHLITRMLSRIRPPAPGLDNVSKKALFSWQDSFDGVSWPSSSSVNISLMVSIARRI